MVCAGQEPQRALQAALEAAQVSVHLIGGADKAEELDAKRAIKQGTELAIALGQSSPSIKGQIASQPASTGVVIVKNDSALPFETVSVSLKDHIATIRLNRPDKANAMNLAMWQEIRKAFQWVDATPEARVAILEAEGKVFTSGIDLQMMMGMGDQIQDDCEARTRENLSLIHI